MVHRKSFAVWASALVLAITSHVQLDAQSVQFNRDVRPILSDNCFACHGPDANKRAADLRLDQRDDAIAHNAFVPGKPEESELIRRILSDDPTTVMPTPESHKTLTPKQKETLKTWIAEGAQYQGHWSFLPPSKPELPQVRNSAWVRNPIDRFVLAELERNGIEPSPESDMRSLIRRVCLDLTGLPPTPEEVEHVLADPSPDRYENYVDELLKRPEWGEHRGRYWLDYARYADTHGIHFDNYREMWAYRDWVIKAFNRNMPFDQFTIEQLAGDLLPNPTLDQRIATGFNRCNITTNEGGTIEEEYKVLYTRDRVETTGQVWLGLTVGCAVCHDHKFDPLGQRDFYSMAAFFNNTTQNAMDGNVKDTPPIVNVPRDEDRDRFNELDSLIANSNQSVTSRRDAAKPSFDAWSQNADERLKMAWERLPAAESLETHIPLHMTTPKWSSVVHQGQLFQFPIAPNAEFAPGRVADQAWLVKGNYPSLQVGDIERDQPFTIAFWVKPGSDTQNGALVARMDESNAFRGWDVWTQNGLVGMHIINRWPENAIKAVSKNRLTASRWQHVEISYDGSSKADGIRIWIDGKETQKTIEKDALSESIRTETPFVIGKRSNNSPSDGAQLQDVRIYRKVLDQNEINAIVSVPRLQYLVSKADRSDDDSKELFEWYLNAKDAQYSQLVAAAKALVDEKAEIQRRGTVAHVMNERNEPPKAYILTRGDYDKRGEEVTPNTPLALPPMPADLPRNRLGFAKWLLMPEHPLTTRVTVNRFWQELFGSGIVASSGDFGVTGLMPTHPELLDYLATNFRDDGWNVKNFFRSIVTSSTYRQSAVVSQEKLAIDPTNKLLTRGPRFRIDAEMVRDYALAASGLLVNKIGGPSVRPYQPPGVWEAVAMPESNTKRYVEDKGEGLYRRSMYTFLKRAAPTPNMEVFNATAREVCTIKRERTNTPLQALVTLNDTQFVEAARILAERTILEFPNGANDPTPRIQSIAKKLIARPMRPEELSVVQSSLNDLMTHYAAHPDQASELLAVGYTRSNESIPPAELAAWTMLVNELFNLDEVLSK